MSPIFLLLVATLPSALGQCTTSKCREQGYEPPRWENGALYLQSLLAQTSDRMVAAVQEALETRLAAQTAAMQDRLETRMAAQTASLETRLATQTAALEDRLTAQTASLAAQTTALEYRLAAQTASLETRLIAKAASLASQTTALEDRLTAQTAALQAKIATLEGRLTASCSAASRDIGDLVSAFQNASSQMAECCESRATTTTVRPSTTPTTRPSTTPTTRPSTTPTTRHSTTPTTRPSTTPTTRPSTTPTTRPSTTPTTRPSTTPTVTPSPTITPSTTPSTTEQPTTTPTECFTLAPTGTPRPVVFLRRQDGSVDFYRDWAAYKCGFGNQAGEFWLGLDNLNNLTTCHNYGLRADLADWSGATLWAVYSTFRVAGEGSGYRLTITGFNRNSTAGDSLSYTNGERFSTRDRDNDDRSDVSCADHHRGGWWYKACTAANLAGRYKPAGYRGYLGIYWERAYNDWRSFKRVTLTLVLT